MEINIIDTKKEKAKERNKIMQIAVFRDPDVKSSVTSNLNAKKARGGIYCDLLSFPQGPSSSCVLKDGKWEEVSHMGNGAVEGSRFAIELDDTDSATTQLLSKLRQNKKIEEIAIYELNTTSNEEQYGYYFHKIFVYQVINKIIRGTRSIQLHCQCISFRQKDNLNNEPVLWDWNTQWNMYTGTMK